MMWTLLALGIMVIFVAGMMLAAKLADKSHGESQVARGNCRRGAINYADRKNLLPGAIFVPKGPR
jgi:hypothetical protein